MRAASGAQSGHCRALHGADGMQPRPRRGIVWLTLEWLGGVALQQPTPWPQPASVVVALVAFGLTALASGGAATP